MNKTLFCLILGVLSIARCNAQVKITWETLKDVKFTEKYNEELGAFIQHPAFGPKVNALSGKEVEISGYIIPLDIPAGIYVLSANPFATCFFCGGGGPESVMDLRFVKPPRRYKTDEKVVLRGKLKLNSNDIYTLNYILEEARQVN
jgi:hypothetical protein